MVDYNDIKNHLIDELNDVLQYLELSEVASDGFEKQFFKDAAKDEKNHAKYLKMILSKNSDIRLSDEELELWNSVEDKCSAI